ncbi:hypothetical protein T492DRAFT_856844 [Pavlovales sp. CCMP2436]|nr:hypothetical protein T492DRAFT_856844 [Pavlovales sp. CCMP2436]
MADAAIDAAAAIAGFEADVTCPRCGWLFTDPVLLPCAHAFCRACVVDASECATCRLPFFTTHATPSPQLRSLLAEFVALKRRLEAFSNGALVVGSDPAGQPPSSPQAREAWWRAYCEVTRKLDACERVLRDDAGPESVRADLRGALGPSVADWQPCDDRSCALSSGALKRTRGAGAGAPQGTHPDAAPGGTHADAADSLVCAPSPTVAAAGSARTAGRVLADATAPAAVAAAASARAAASKRPRVAGASSAQPKSHATEVVLLMSSLPDESSALVKQAVRTLPGTSVVKSWSASATHIITEPIDFCGKRLASRTLKHLCGILSGQWIVSSAWVRASLEQGAWVPEESYELDGDMSTSGQHGPSKGRAAHVAGASAIFRGLRIYLHGKFAHPSPSKPQLLELLGLGGASICASLGSLQNEAIRSGGVSVFAMCDGEELSADFCAKCVQLRIPILSPKWLMDSISHVTCLDFSAADSEFRLDTARLGATESKSISDL